MNCLNCYGYKENTSGLVSLKTQFQTEQGAVDKAQNKKIDELADLINEESGETVEKIVETTYSNLKTLRDNAQLVPGQFYRIIDYETTTAQQDTRSAGNLFDVIVLALDEKTLSEDAWAIQSERDNELKSITECDTAGNEGDKYFIYYRSQENDGDYNGEHYYAFKDGDNYYVYTKSLTEIPTAENVFAFFDENGGEYLEISDPNITTVKTTEEGGTIVSNYNIGYFSNSNLNAWKIWYCLDNDANRFAWAVEEQVIINPTIVTATEGRSTSLYIQTGVYDNYYIYKKLVNSTKLTAEEYIEQIGTYQTEKNIVWYSTKNDSEIVVGNILVDTLTGKVTTVEVTNVYVQEPTIIPGGKGIIYRMIDEYDNDCPYDFKNIQFKRYKITECEDVPDLEGMYAIGNINGIIVDIDTTFWCYTFCMIDAGSDEGHDVSVEQDVYYGDEGYTYKTSNNVFKPHYDVIYDDNDEPTYLMMLPDNVMTTDTELCSIEGNYGEFYGYYNNTFGGECLENTIGNNCYENTIGNGFGSNTIGNDFSYNTIGNVFVNNTIGNDFSYNTIGNGCCNITIEKDCVRYIIIEDGNQYLTITSTQTTSLSNQLINLTIAQGANNTNTNKIIYHNSVGDTQKTVYSSGSINYVSIDEE